MSNLYKTGCPDCGAQGNAHSANCRVVDKAEIAPVMPAPEWFAGHRADGSVPGALEAAIGHDVKTQIADEAKNIVAGARRKAYGTPEQNFERIARFWQAYFENTGRPDARITAADVSPLMRLMKEARLAETPGHYDSFVDLVGYTLTGAEVNKVAKPSS